jgi:acyl-[acyl-carrier-protein]-phospholipid O-acyltransferase/long-chain-fatty-acid--[acyl-carrier-protein] ligase
MLRAYFRLFHQAAIAGLQHYPPPGVPVIVVANHLSLADGPLLVAFLPGDPTFVIDADIAARWWIRPLLWPMRVVRVDPRKPFAVRAMIDAVRAGERLVVFPEGRISVTGGLMKMQGGTGLIADKAAAPILPVRIDGTQFSRLSYLKGKLRRRWFAPISLTGFPPRPLSLDPSLLGRRRRQQAELTLQDIMIEVAYATQDTGHSLFAALLAARRRHGGRLQVLEDTDGTRPTYRRVVLGACVLGRALAGRTRPGEAVGLLLPSAAATAIGFMALQAFARVPALLNTASGADGMLRACRLAEIRLVVSSRRFVERGRLSQQVAAMAGQVGFLWLEDIRADLGLAARLRGWLDTARARQLPGFGRPPDAPAVVLFTSGTEGAPKGVVLSHRNILANCAQAAAVLDFTSADVVFNALPMFHAFGLTVGTLLPLLSGVRTVLYPTPLHYRLIPGLIYNTDATIVFGTDTFLAGWARYAHPYDFRSVRYLLVGAERLRETTKQVYAERFGVRLLEGYGATETAPVLAINTPLRHAAGSVGRFLPGLTWRLEPVAGLEAAGRLWVRGPNVMLGYLHAERPWVLKPPADGWYDTGDIVSVGPGNFLTILDRARRFAKIGGEMVPLAAAEELAAAVWPDAAHAVVALADARKGERLILVTTAPGAEAGPLLRLAQARGGAEIMVPRTVLVLPRLPRLGSGKPDYPAIHRLAEAAVSGEDTSPTAVRSDMA